MSLAKGATLQIVDSQVSPTLRKSASGQGSSLGFLRVCAAHSTIRKRPLRRFKFAPELGKTVLGMLSNPVGDTLSSTGRQVDEREANVSAFTLLTARNAARAALTAYSARGQLASWRQALPDLPEDYIEAVDYLEVFTQHLVEELQTDLAALTPHIAGLNAQQPSKTCWARPVPKNAKRGIWAGRSLWVDHALDYLIPLMREASRAIAEQNLRAIVTAFASFADQSGRNVTASHETVANLAKDEFACTLALSTAKQRVRTIRRLLEMGGFLITHVRGGHLTSLERISAELHHGGRQSRCGNTSDLNLPEHLRPTPPPSPDGPAYAQGLAERLIERDRQMLKKSTYTVGSGPQSLIGTTWVAHPRACAQEHPDNSTLNPEKITPSLRDWRITDDLTRTGTHTAAENGPYAHLIGSAPSQMSPAQLARLIATLVPSEVGTKTLLRGLAHAATSQSTGFIALGLRTRPSNARAWLAAVLRSIDWAQSESFPSWSTTARAFGVHWCGDRHKWRPTSPQTVVSDVSVGAPASAEQRAVCLAQIRQALVR